MPQLFNQGLELMLSTKLIQKEQDRQCYLEFLVVITRNWKIIANENLKNIEYYQTATEVICNLIEYTSYHGNILQKDEMSLISLVTDKILILTEYAINDAKGSIKHLEIFYKFFFQLLYIMDGLSVSKIQILNLFFKLKGHNLLYQVNTNDSLLNTELKLIFSEIMTQFTAAQQNVKESKMKILRKLLYSIFSAQAPEHENQDDFKLIVKSYVELKLGSIGNKKEALITISNLIVKLKAVNFSLDTILLVMLITIFSDLFMTEIDASQRGGPVQKAQTVCKTCLASVSPEITKNFLRWLVHIRQQKQEDCESYILKYISRDFFTCDKNSLNIYEPKWLAKFYFDNNTEKTMRKNILQIFKRYRLRMIESRKLMTRLGKCIKNHIEFEVREILDVLSQNNEHYNLQICTSNMWPFVADVLEKEFNDIDVRFKAVYLGSCLILRIIFFYKSTNKKLYPDL